MMTVDEMMQRLHFRGHTDIVSMWSERRGMGFVVTWNLLNTATIILEIPNEERFWMDFTMNQLGSTSGETVDDALVSYYANYITKWKHEHLYKRVLKAEWELFKLPEPKDES